jgi:hypothetical protein
MNGDFVEPKHYVPKTIAQTKLELKEQLLGPFAQTRFSIPEYLENREELIDNAMDVIQQNYFSTYGNKTLTKEQFQSFIFLTYAEMTIQLCRGLKMTSIAEAHSKLF